VTDLEFRVYDSDSMFKIYGKRVLCSGLTQAIRILLKGFTSASTLASSSISAASFGAEIIYNVQDSWFRV
jgi:hypothetical protein